MNGAMALLATDSWNGIRSRPYRSALMVMSLSVGMFVLSLTVIISSSLSGQAQLLALRLGAGAFVVTAGQATSPGARALQSNDVQLLAANLPGSNAARVRYDTVQTPGHAQPVLIVAADPALAAIRNWRAARGRLLDAHDFATRARHIVISQGLQAQTGWRVGYVARLGEASFEVIGVLHGDATAASSHSGESLASGGGSFAMVPLSLAPVWLGGFALDPRDRVDAIFVNVPGDNEVERNARVAAQLLAPARGAPAFEIITPQLLTAGIRALRRSLVTTAGIFSGLALLLGGATMTGFLLASLRERLAEIGLRRSLGATRSDIAWLIVTEALMLTAIAALIGLFSATQSLDALGRQLEIALVMDAAAMLWPLAASAGIAIVFSWWPARLAAAIQPADALRAA